MDAVKPRIVVSCEHKNVPVQGSFLHWDLFPCEDLQPWEDLQHQSFQTHQHELCASIIWSKV